jgi:hypothetical protein
LWPSQEQQQQVALSSSSKSWQWQLRKNKGQSVWQQQKLSHGSCGLFPGNAGEGDEGEGSIDHYITFGSWDPILCTLLQGKGHGQILQQQRK